MKSAQQITEQTAVNLAVSYGRLSGYAIMASDFVSEVEDRQEKKRWRDAARKYAEAARHTLAAVRASLSENNL